MKTKPLFFRTLYFVERTEKMSNLLTLELEKFMFL